MYRFKMPGCVAASRGRPGTRQDYQSVIRRIPESRLFRGWPIARLYNAEGAVYICPQRTPSFGAQRRRAGFPS